MIIEKAPAKINLTLEVLGKRPDGYREIRSVMQTVGLCDTLSLAEADETIIQCNQPGWMADKSLVAAAVDIVKESADWHRGVRIAIDKRIPLLSGLGGDSSDAAAVLRGLNRLWGLGLSLEQLREMAGKLGSDVSFFLYGGAALATGRGEQITPLPPLPDRWVVLVVPDIPRKPGKTAKMYQALKPLHYTSGETTGKLVAAINSRKEIEASMLFNTFENVAFQGARLRVYCEHLKKMGAPHAHIAGSGPTLFTIYEDENKAQDIFSLCKSQNMEVYLVKTL